MLLQFDIENNRSIKNKKRLSFIADNKPEHKEALIKYDKHNILPVIGIYGKNAAGKTNILKSFKHIRNMIRFSHEFNPVMPIPFYEPFKFTNDIDIPSSFEVSFICKDKKYNYGFSHNSSEILEEYLYVFNSVKPTKIFERSFNNNNDNFSFGNNYENMEYLTERTHKNKLFLSVAAQWAAKIEEINDIFNYFENSILYYQKNWNEPSNEFFEKTTQLLIENEEARDFIKNLIKHLDLEFENIKVNRQTVDIEKLPEEIQLLIKNLNSNKENEKSELTASQISSLYNINEEEYSLNLKDESNGIQKLYDLFSILFESFTKQKIVIIDEIEMGLHPILAKELIRLFQDLTINKFHSQLLFTTHDTNILNTSLLRRDQFWFVSKDIKNNYATDLYSLSDINGVRINDNIARNYLLGKYSTIPEIYFGDNEDDKKF